MTNMEINTSLGEFSLGKYISLLLHWAWFLIAVSIFAGAMAFAASKIMTPVYLADTTIMINQLPANETANYASIQMNVQLSQAYSQMIPTTTILDEVSKRLSLEKIDPNTVTAEPLTNIQMIFITVEADEPEKAAKIANTVVEVFREQAQAIEAERYTKIEETLQSQIEEVEEQIHQANIQLSSAVLDADIALINTKIDSYQETYVSLLQELQTTQATKAESSTSIIQIEQATPPEEPDRPQTILYVAIAVMVGFILAAGMVYIIGISDPTLKNVEDYSAKLGLPLLGSVPRHRDRKKLTIVDQDPQSPAAEAFRALRTNIYFSTIKTEQPMQTIMIVSPSAGEGKTTVAANLGVAIAQSGQNVCLIDANLRRPEIHNRLNIPNQGGLSHVLESKKSKTSIKHYLQSTRLPNLKVLTSGEIPSSPSEILNSPRLSDALEGLKADSNIILIDTPPTTAVTDAMELIPFVDGVLIVVKAGYTKPELASQLVKQLQRVNANILGIVGNNFSSQTPRYRSRQHIDKVQVFIQFVKINTQKLLQQVKSWIYPKFPSDIQ